jgi:hypothetical protein
MRRQQLNTYLKDIHRGLQAIRYSNRSKYTHGGNDAVYFYNQHMGSIPQGNIYLKRNERYKNIQGYTHRSLMGLKKLLWIKGIIRRQNDQAVRRLCIS